ncbi:MAG: hypothetical protein Fur0043_15640 [Anaerolineales bacterium]
MQGKNDRLINLFNWLEEVIYYAIGAALIVAALAALVLAGVQFFGNIHKDLYDAVLRLLDALLLVMMLVEILHTINISLRQHVLTSEPFLIVGLIAAVRRMLVITAEQSRLMESPEVFRLMLLELMLLGGLILVLSAAIFILRRSQSEI